MHPLVQPKERPKRRHVSVENLLQPFVPRESAEPVVECQVGREEPHVARPARGQLVGERLQVGIGPGSVGEHLEQGGQPFLQLPDGAREQVADAGGVPLGPDLSHDVALQGRHRRLGPGQRGLDQVPEQGGLGAERGVHRLVRHPGRRGDRRHGGGGVAALDEEPARRGHDGAAALLRRRPAAWGVVAASRRCPLDSLVHEGYDSTYSPDASSDEKTPSFSPPEEG